MSFNLANKPLAERAALEDEKSRLYDLWQSNLGKAKGDAARLFGERAKRKGKWAEWVRPINHAGEHYRVAGPHLTSPSPQRTPLLIQAGWSGRYQQHKAAEQIKTGAPQRHQIDAPCQQWRGH